MENKDLISIGLSLPHFLFLIPFFLLINGLLKAIICSHFTGFLPVFSYLCPPDLKPLGFIK